MDEERENSERTFELHQIIDLNKSGKSNPSTVAGSLSGTLDDRK